MAKSASKLYLTKSRHMAGLQCPKRLWLTCHDPLPYEDAPVGSPMAVGIQVGQKAWEIFPGGIYVDAMPWEHDAAVTRTHELINDSDVPAIFEGAFEHDGVRIRADIIERLLDGSWRLHEVKSSGSVKDNYYYDLAVQVHVLQGAGLNISSYGVIHIDTSYTLRKKGIDWGKFFKRVDLTKELDLFLDETPDLIAVNQRILRKRKVPEVDLIKSCGGCDFWDHCTADMPEDWIFGLPYLSQKKLEELSAIDVVAIRDIPNEFPLTENQRKVRRVWLDDKPYISSDLSQVIKPFGPPAYYLDFETTGPAIPLYTGTKPFQHIPVQWSLHHMDESGLLDHAEYLADGETDPRREFAETLLDALHGSHEPIIVYSSYEKTTLGKLAAQFPDLAKGINRLIDRLADLLPIVSKHTYFKEFNGSFSIKKVVPVLVPHLSYDNLDLVADGQAASTAFESIARGTIGSDVDILRLRAALYEYCKLDTLAMVEAHRVLRGKIGLT